MKLINASLLFILFNFFSNHSFGQERKINKSIEYIQTNEFDKAEELISTIYLKTPKSPTILWVKSLLYGSLNYSKYNIDSSFIYYCGAIEEVQKLEAKEQLEICTDFKLCLSRAQSVKDSIAGVAFLKYKSHNSIDMMRVFNNVYKGTSFIQSSNDLIEDLYYKNANELNTTSSYSDFLKMYPSSSKRDVVQAKIHEIEFKLVVSKNEKIAYQNYLDTYPKSTHCNEVRKKIETLDYEKTKSSMSFKDFEEFTKTYPNSLYLKEIQEVYELPYFNEAMKQRDIASLNNFKLRYPASKHLKDVNEVICELTFEGVKKINTRNAYKEFVRLFPNSKFESEAQKKIIDLFPIVPKLLASGQYIYVDKFTGEDLFGREYEKAGLYQNNQAIVMENGKYGVIDENGQTIIPAFYDEIQLCTNPDLYLVTMNKRQGLFNNEGKKLLNADYENDYMFDNKDFIGFNAFGKESTGGLPDFQFKIVNKGLVKYQCPYDELPAFTNGLAIVSKGNDIENSILGLYAIINENYQEVIPFKYNFIAPVYDRTDLFYFNVGGTGEYTDGGIYPIAGKWGVVNSTGKVIIPAIFDELTRLYSEDKSKPIYFVANRGRNTDTGEDPEIPGNCGLIDINGNEIIPFEYQDITDGGKDQLIVNKGGHLSYVEYGAYISGGKWGVIDFSNKVKVPIIYDELNLAKNNFTFRKGSKIGEYGEYEGGKYGLVSIDNKMVIPATYDYLDAYTSGKAVLVCLGCQTASEPGMPMMPYGGKWGAFDQKGKIILTTSYSEISTTADSNLLILNNGKVFGKEYPGEVKIEGKFGVSDCSGKLILPVKFDQIIVGSKYIFAKLADKYQVYSKQGALASDKKFDDITELSNSYFSFRIGEKNGILKSDLSELFPARFWATKTELGYDYDISIEGPFFKIQEAGSSFYATEKGEIFKE